MYEYIFLCAMSLQTTDEISGADGVYGVLLDVSGSMRSAYAIDQSHDASVERTHAIFTSILNIVKKEVVHHNRQEIIFASVFGLNQKSTGVDVCDLLVLLDLLRNSPDDGYDALIRLAEQQGVRDRIERWINEIKTCLSQVEARLLYAILRENLPLIHELSDLIPSAFSKVGVDVYRGSASGLEWALNKVTLGMVDTNHFSNRAEENVKEQVFESPAYKRAKEIISDTLKQPLAPQPIEMVSNMLDDLISADTDKYHYSEMMSVKIQKLIEVVKPFIFEYTPMCKALKNAMIIFEKKRLKDKSILFILSDGVASDGDPRPIAEKLRSMDVIVATCFLTSDPIESPKMLYDKSQMSCWGDDGRKVLFEMSSVMENTQPPISHLVDADWELPLSGESCLFFQANSLDVVNEFCRIVISQMTMSCDALVELIGKVDLATLINQKNAQFPVKEQELETCYANAVAAVFHLAMHRIVGREGGYPCFKKIRQRIVDEYGYRGANTEIVLNNVSKLYRLHVSQVDEKGARRAINMRRPVVARFIWSGKERQKFEEFFKCYPKGILKKDHLRGASQTNASGHAVVLTRCSPKGLTFMNSWGEKFANGGFFTLEDEHIFHYPIKFYDVEWFESELKQSETMAFKRESSKRCKELGETFPSALKLPFVCPKCNRESQIKEFSGHALDATCPKCSQHFKPTNEQLIESLYLQAHKPVKS